MVGLLACLLLFNVSKSIRQAPADSASVVAPLDNFRVMGGSLRFRDLAVDAGRKNARAYDVEIRFSGGRAPETRRVRLTGGSLPLPNHEGSPSFLSLEISVAGDDAKPVKVDLAREGSQWTVARVRQG